MRASDCAAAARGEDEHANKFLNNFSNRRLPRQFGARIWPSDENIIDMHTFDTHSFTSSPRAQKETPHWLIEASRNGGIHY